MENISLLKNRKNLFFSRTQGVDVRLGVKIRIIVIHEREVRERERERKKERTANVRK